MEDNPYLISWVFLELGLNLNYKMILEYILMIIVGPIGPLSIRPPLDYIYNLVL